MDRRANRNSGWAVWMVMLAAAGALWNCGIVSGAVGNVFPADGSAINGTVHSPSGNVYTFLDASPGLTAVSYVCYFSHIEAEVAGRVEDANLGPQLSSVPNLRWIVGLPDDVLPGSHYPDGLVQGTTYYWSVDETDGNNVVWEGPVWSFYLQNYRACCPDPPDGAINIDPDVLLCWVSGRDVQERDIYFSTSFDDVNDGDYPPIIMPPGPWTQPVGYDCWDPVADGGLTIEFGTTYYWRVDEVSGRFMPGTGTIYKGDVWSFTTVSEGPGTIRMDLWNVPCLPPDICLDYISNHNPDETEFLTSFDSGVYLGDMYVGMIRGWLHPQESGDYRFWLCTDDNGELWLSTDEGPADAVLISSVKPGWADPYNWYDADVTPSGPIYLVGGRKYYITALWQEGGGGDHCMVAWQGPDQPLAPVSGSADAIIPGDRLSPLVQFYAHDPDPCDGQAGVALPVTLRWEPGGNAAEHNVYIGTNFNSVKRASSEVFLATTTEPNILVTGLAFNTKYYWRVDEFRLLIPGLPWPTVPSYEGDVWSFTTEGQRIFVDVDAAGANNGSSWEDAYNYLQDALADANSSEKPVEICVAEGIYKPDQGGGQTIGDRTATFKLINGVTLKGGYAGFGETNPNARDIKLYETILSGDLDGNDVDVNDPADLLDEPTRAENSYHVVIGIGIDANAVLNGFIIRGGNAEGANYGGGVYNNNGSPAIINCIFSENSAGRSGGGMYNNSESHPTVTNCTFILNAAYSGGGMQNRDFCKPMLANCTFIRNLSYGRAGGGICGGYGSIINCTFTENSANKYGGGLSDCGGLISDCTITGNSAGISGGGFDYAQANPGTLINCIISSNTSGNEGGGIYFRPPTVPPPLGDPPYPSYPMIVITNCTVSGNVTGGDGGGIFTSFGRSLLTNCIFWGDTPDEIYGDISMVTYSDVQGGWPGLGNIDAYPCFASAYNGDYHLKSQAGRWEPSSESWFKDYVSSPCIDAGNPGCPVGDEPSPNGNRRNMGAYGGTAEASKSPANWRSIADMTNDRVVDSNDLKVFADYWLGSGECIPSDFDRSHFVDFDDFAIFGLHWSYPSAFEPGMTFHIGDCTMEAGQKWTSAAEPNEPRFSVWVEGRYIYFEDQMYANCCPDELGLDKEINGNEITLYEIGYGGLCNCMCYFPITATLGPFEDGTYTVEVYDNYGKSLGVVEVTIGQPSEPTIIYKIEDCNRNASGVFAATAPDLTRFTVTVKGPYIHFKDMMYANCCPDKLELEMTIEDNLITIYENEYTSEGCRCMCSFPITATLGPFEPGIYTLEVYETTGGFIGSTTVVIEQPQ